jgi:uncharacterized membrane protein
MANEVEQKQGRAGRLVLGLFLVLIGALLLADHAGLDVLGSAWSYWPLLLIGMGVAKLLWPGGPEERDGGFWLLVVGGYAWISTRHLFGLSWGTAWPLVLMAVGLQMALRGWGRRGRAAGEARRDAE